MHIFHTKDNTLIIMQTFYIVENQKAIEVTYIIHEIVVMIRKTTALENLKHQNSQMFFSNPAAEERKLKAQPQRALKVQ